MLPGCDACGFSYTREPGFYLGSIYINYAVTVIVTGLLYAVTVVVLDWTHRAALTGCLAVAVLLPVVFFRQSRAFLLALDSSVNQHQPDHGAIGDEDAQLSAARLQELSSDDARAGMMMAASVVLVAVFGLLMAAATLAFILNSGQETTVYDPVDLR